MLRAQKYWRFTYYDEPYNFIFVELEFSDI